MPYREKSGKWRATKMIDGQRRTKSFETKTEARKWEANLTKGILEETSTDMVSLIELANGYLDHAKNTVSEKTYRDEKVPAFKRLFKDVAPDLPVEKLVPRDCLKFLTAKTHNL